MDDKFNDQSLPPEPPPAPIITIEEVEIYEARERREKILNILARLEELRSFINFYAPFYHQWFNNNVTKVLESNSTNLAIRHFDKIEHALLESLNDQVREMLIKNLSSLHSTSQTSPSRSQSSLRSLSQLPRNYSLLLDELSPQLEKCNTQRNKLGVFKFISKRLMTLYSFVESHVPTYLRSFYLHVKEIEEIDDVNSVIIRLDTMKQELMISLNDQLRQTLRRILLTLPSDYWRELEFLPDFNSPRLPTPPPAPPFPAPPSPTSLPENDRILEMRSIISAHIKSLKSFAESHAPSYHRWLFKNIEGVEESIYLDSALQHLEGIESKLLGFVKSKRTKLKRRQSSSSDDSDHNDCQCSNCNKKRPRR